MDKNILLGVSGGIAAYKAIDLASKLSKAGYSVKTILTENASRFVAGINFAAITHGSVHSQLFEDADPIPHITLADWADLIVVAPATANILAKAAQGIADDLLSTTLLAHAEPVLYVPAMNVNMYQSQATQANLNILRVRETMFWSRIQGCSPADMRARESILPTRRSQMPSAAIWNILKTLTGSAFWSPQAPQQSR